VFAYNFFKMFFPFVVFHFFGFFNFVFSPSHHFSQNIVPFVFAVSQTVVLFAQGLFSRYMTFTFLFCKERIFFEFWEKKKTPKQIFFEVVLVWFVVVIIETSVMVFWKIAKTKRKSDRHLTQDWRLAVLGHFV